VGYILFVLILLFYIEQKGRKDRIQKKNRHGGEQQRYRGEGALMVLTVFQQMAYVTVYKLLLFCSDIKFRT